MIRHFEDAPAMEPEGNGQFQWGAALCAGLIPGVLLLLAPSGSPWSGISFFSNVVMGRPMPPGVFLPLPVLCLVHLAIAELYGLIISLFVTHITQGRAILAGGALGIALYVINFGFVSLFAPDWRGSEIGVLFTHVVFGLIAGGAYRGLLRRKAVAA
jgi:hypothetical protein